MDRMKAKAHAISVFGRPTDCRSFVNKVPVCHRRQCNTPMTCSYSEEGTVLFECLVCGRVVLVETKEAESDEAVPPALR